MSRKLGAIQSSDRGLDAYVLAGRLTAKLKDYLKLIEDQADIEKLSEGIYGVSGLLPLFLYDAILSQEKIPAVAYMPFISMGKIDLALDLFLKEYSQESGDDPNYDLQMKERFLRTLPDFHGIDLERLEAEIEGLAKY